MNFGGPGATTETVLSSFLSGAFKSVFLVLCQFEVLNHLRCDEASERFQSSRSREDSTRCFRNNKQPSLPTVTSPWRQTDRRGGSTFSSWGQEAGTGRRSYTASCPPEETTGQGNNTNFRWSFTLCFYYFHYDSNFPFFYYFFHTFSLSSLSSSEHWENFSVWTYEKEKIKPPDQQISFQRRLHSFTLGSTLSHILLNRLGVWCARMISGFHFLSMLSLSRCTYVDYW